MAEPRRMAGSLVVPGCGGTLDGVEFVFCTPGPPRARRQLRILRAACQCRRAFCFVAGGHSRKRRGKAGRRCGFAADLVLVAHHGSATASGEVLRSATRVTGGGYAVVSAGYRNRWGFPRPAVRAGWQQAGRQLSVTADAGALEYSVAADGAQRLAAQRRAEPRWWRPATEPWPRPCRRRFAVQFRFVGSLKQERARPMWEIFKTGGPVMWPILLCSIVAVAIMAERFWSLQDHRVLPPELAAKVWKLIEAKQLADRHVTSLAQNSPLGRVLRPVCRTVIVRAKSSRNPSRTPAAMWCTNWSVT